MPKILLKSMSIKEQLKGRIKLIQEGKADGLELYGNFPVNRDLINFVAENVPVFHYEPLDFLSKNVKGKQGFYDLTDVLSRDEDRREKTRNFIETAIKTTFKAVHINGIEEHFLFNIHWVGDCNVKGEYNELLTEEEIKKVNEDLLTYYIEDIPNKVGISRENLQNFLSFENVYHESIHHGKPDIMYAPTGRYFEDFPEEFNITVDVAHKGMDVRLTQQASRISEREISKGSEKSRYTFKTYFQQREENIILKMGELDDDITSHVIGQLNQFSPKQVHLTNYKYNKEFGSLKDGSIDGELDLKRIIPQLHRVTYVVTEVAESTGDYINVPDQIKLAEMIRQGI